MPEGDNLFRAATALHKALAGARVRGFRSDVPLLRRDLLDLQVDVLELHGPVVQQRQ